MSDIPLHPERGLDPHLMYCQRCGEDTGSITVGDVIRRKMQDGRILLANRGEGVSSAIQAGYTKQDYYNAEIIPIKEGERLPDTSVCAECDAELTMQKGIIEAGGIAFRCTMCHQEGVIRKSDFADGVRKSAGIEAPIPVGVEFTRCAEHREPTEKNLAASSAKEDENNENNENNESN